MEGQSKGSEISEATIRLDRQTAEDLYDLLIGMEVLRVVGRVPRPPTEVETRLMEFHQTLSQEFHFDALPGQTFSSDQPDRIAAQVIEELVGQTPGPDAATQLSFLSPIEEIMMQGHG